MFLIVLKILYLMYFVAGSLDFFPKIKGFWMNTLKGSTCYFSGVSVRSYFAIETEPKVVSGTIIRIYFI